MRVPNGATALLSGMYATARIIEATSANAIVLPKEAVTTRDGKRGVQRVQGDTVTFVEVTEGLSDGARVQIVSGLAAGDTVMLHASIRLPPARKSAASSLVKSAI